ncbi:hypothetical protein [Embleya sp. NPDC005575]|uniref:hypothetical protein n=1 Tax=Embleya sp. NPDC005575 TaxID=3156892 RepID=UPI00339EBAD3
MSHRIAYAPDAEVERAHLSPERRKCEDGCVVEDMAAFRPTLSGSRVAAHAETGDADPVHDRLEPDAARKMCCPGQERLLPSPGARDA